MAPGSATYFADENALGLAKILIRQGRSDILHPGHEALLEVPLGTPDVDWMRVVAAMDLVVVTRDRRIRARPVGASRDTPYKRKVLDECMRPLVNVVQGIDIKAGKAPTKFGAECDLLALDADGRLLAVEVKPSNVGTIAWVPAQAAMYARVLQRWVDVDIESAKNGDGPPVVILQRGADDAKLKQMQAVNEALADADLGVPAVEIYEVSMTGRIRPLA